MSGKCYICSCLYMRGNVFSKVIVVLTCNVRYMQGDGVARVGPTAHMC